MKLRKGLLLVVVVELVLVLLVQQETHPNKASSTRAQTFFEAEIFSPVFLKISVHA